MANDVKKTKPDPAPKKEAAAADKSTPAAEAPKAADAPKTDGGEKPTTYSRGEGQKPVTQAYKDNWNAIFAKKPKTKKKR